MDDIYELIKDEVITLNGITAEIFPCSNDHVLITNIDFEKDDSEGDELIVTKKEFVLNLKHQNGRFRI